MKLSYAPPQGSKLLRERIASLHGVDPDHVLVMTGASEALIALTCLFAAPGASIVVPRPAYPAVPVLARAWGMEVREYALRPDYGFSQTAEAVLSVVDASTRVVFVNTPHNPTGSVMPANEQRKLAELLAARGIPLIVDEVYHPLYHSAPIPSAAKLPNTIVLGDFAKALSIPGLRIGWLIDADPERREALLDLRSYFTISGSPLTEAIGAHALAHADAILGRLRVGVPGQSRVAHEVHARASRGTGLDAARRRDHVFPMVAGWTRCAAAVRGVGQGRRARRSG